MAESYQHYRNSFHVAWTATDIPRLATELYEQTIPDVHLSLLGYWILERDEHYNYAKRYIRELGLDQGYKVDRIRNLKLRKLLQDTYESRPEWVAGVDEDKDEDEAGSTRLKRSKSQWLKDTLQQLDDSLKQRALKAVLHDDRIKRALPNTPSHSTKSTPLRGTQSTPSQGTIGINIDKNRSVSSPLIARIDRLPESLRIQRQRLMEKAARSASLECPESPTTVFPPNTPDRPAPLALRSTNSFYSSGTPTRGMRNPIANSALELHASPKSDQTSTRYLTPGEEYLSTPTSPRARYIFTPTQSHSPLLPSLDALFHTIEETVEDDVFGIPETLTRNKRSTSHSRIEHRSSSVYSQHGSNRLSDLDWQTTSSEEEDNDLEKSLQISSNRSSIGRASQIYREYENLIPATREFHNSNSAFDEEEAFKANNRHAHCNSQCYALYELDPEDEPEEDPEYREKLQALLESLSTHEDSSEEESILESASESSGQGPRTRYTYTNALSPSTPPFTSRRERAIAETLAQLNGTPM